MLLGVDIVELARIEALMRHDHFLTHCFTDSERAMIAEKADPVEAAAGLFAAKEAVAKALGTGFEGIGFKMIAITHSVSGAPAVRLSGAAQQALRAKGGAAIRLSISHEQRYAVAVAAAETSGAHGIGAFNLNETLNHSLLKRDRRGYKSQYGRIAIVGGSAGMAGAVCMAAQAALRTGSGLVYAVVPKSIAGIVQIKLTEAIVLPVEDDRRGHFLPSYAQDVVEAVSRCDCVAIGPGIGRAAGMSAWLVEVLDGIDVPTVLDADALYAVAQDRERLAPRLAGCVITPHEMEMSRLTNESVQAIRTHRLAVAAAFAARYHVEVILKGAETIITDGRVSYLNNTGNPGMATAGSGDVLTGMLAALLGYGYQRLTAVRLSCYLHGLAGDMAAAEIGEDGLIATDIIAKLPYVLKELQALNRDEHI